MATTPVFPLVDCHNHLQNSIFQDRLGVVLPRALDAGVLGMAVNGVAESDWPAVLSLARSYSCLFPFLGLHPWYMEGRSRDWLEILESYLLMVPAGVGEIGLDRWIKSENEKAQEEAFRAQLKLARRLGRPANVHCLKAWGWFLEVMKIEKALPCGFVLHAYGGPVEFIEPLAAMGARFSFAGNVLDERKTRMQSAFKATPLDRLLLETDAPDLLPPEPYQPYAHAGEDGRLKNDPAHLAVFFPALARLRGMEPEALAAALWENSRRFLAPIRDLGPMPPCGV
jgi:TatD DNase family protein